MPVIRQMSVVIVVLRSLFTEAQRQVAAGRPSGVVLAWLLGELDQVIGSMDSGTPAIDSAAASTPDLPDKR